MTPKCAKAKSSATRRTTPAIAHVPVLIDTRPALLRVVTCGLTVLLAASWFLSLTEPSAAASLDFEAIQRIDACALVCNKPGEKLDAVSCRCVPGGEPPKPCGLVCIKPGQVLDAANCRCIGEPAPR